MTKRVTLNLRIKAAATPGILAGDGVLAREKRLGFVRDEDCIDGGSVNDECADVRLAVEDMD